MRREPYWSLQEGDRPLLSEFSGRAREVVIFRLETPQEDLAHLEGQYMWDFEQDSVDMQVIDPLGEQVMREYEEERMEAIRLELDRMRKKELMRI